MAQKHAVEVGELLTTLTYKFNVETTNRSSDTKSRGNKYGVKVSDKFVVHSR